MAVTMTDDSTVVEEVDPNINELISRIIDCVDDFLWCHHVDLGNTEPRGVDEDDVIIYGSQYNDLYEELFDTINNMWI